MDLVLEVRPRLQNPDQRSGINLLGQAPACVIVYCSACLQCRRAVHGFVGLIRVIFDFAGQVAKVPCMKDAFATESTSHLHAGCDAPDQLRSRGSSPVSKREYITRSRAVMSLLTICVNFAVILIIPGLQFDYTKFEEFR